MKKVMIVDDEKEFLDEINEVLVLSGYDTALYSEGRRAIEEAGRIKPDVILLDLKMDEISGFGVANELSKSSATAEIPIIAITGVYTEEEHRFVMRACGIKRCLVKPLKPLDVIAAIENVV